MFHELIAKVCEKEPTCVLKGQQQEKGLSLCPECASELIPVYRTRKDRIALVASLLLVLLLVGGTFGYGTAALQLTPAQTLSWLSGRVTLRDDVSAPKNRAPWFHGRIVWFFSGGRPREFSDQLLCEQRGDEYWFRPRFKASNGDQIHFELNSQQGYVYTFYRTDGPSQRLYPDGGAAATPGSEIRVPAKQNMRLSGGTSTETFLIVASRKEQHQLAELQEGQYSGSKLDDVAKTLSADKENNLVMFVQVPHS